jgi:hypothetical protein
MGDPNGDIRRGRSGWLLLAAWVAGGLVFVLAVAGAVAVGLRSRAPVLTAQSPGPVATAFGTLFLRDPEAGYVATASDGTHGCVGQGQFADLKPGAPIEIRAGATVVATGKLNGGVGYDRICHFSWAAVGVPLGLGSYQVAMEGRGAVDVFEEELDFAIALQVAPPDGQLESWTGQVSRPGPIPTGTGFSKTVTGDIWLLVPDGDFDWFARCTGTGVNADLPGADVVLSRAGTTVGSAKLERGFAYATGICIIGWSLNLDAPPSAGQYTLTLTGHGSVNVEFVAAGPLVIDVVLDDSGQIRFCGPHDPIAC